MEGFMQLPEVITVTSGSLALRQATVNRLTSFYSFFNRTCDNEV